MEYPNKRRSMTSAERRRVQLALIRLVGWALSARQGDPPVPASLDWDALYRVSQEQRVAALVACALEKSPDWPNRGARFMDAQFAAMRLEATMHFEMSALYERLEALGVDYCPLKGLLAKQLYPEPYLRTMSDADILVRERDLARLRPELASLGFAYSAHYSVHDVYLNATRLYRLELHDQLLHSWNANAALYARPFERFARVTAHGYRMDLCEQYLYALLHLEKHLDYNGIYMRMLVDFYLLRRALGERLEAAHAMVERAGLGRLEAQLNALTRAWFEGGSMNRNLREFEAYLFDCFDGTKTVQRQYNVERWNLRRVHIDPGNGNALEMLFPTRQMLTERLPILKRRPRLLPLLSVLDFPRRCARILMHMLRLSVLRLRGARRIRF